MKTIYVLVDNGIPILAFDTKVDGAKTVNNMFGKSAKAVDEHLFAVSYSETSQKIVQSENLEDVIEIASSAAVNACIQLVNLLEDDD